jgi:hypothetical protein
MDPQTILVAIVASLAVVCFGAGFGACFLWLNERVGRKDDVIGQLKGALEQEHEEANVAAASRRNQAAGNAAIADALRGADDGARLKRVLALFPRAGSKPAPAAADATDDAGASRQPRRVG